MTEQEMRIAIAESVGWKNVRYDYANGSDTFKSWLGDRCGYVNEPPNYPQDLNVMHEVIESLPAEEKLKYICQIYVTTGTEGTDSGMLYDDLKIHNATAIQRAEAYLRTKGLWKD